MNYIEPDIPAIAEMIITGEHTVIGLNASRCALFKTDRFIDTVYDAVNSITCGLGMQRIAISHFYLDCFNTELPNANADEILILTVDLVRASQAFHAMFEQMQLPVIQLPRIHTKVSKQQAAVREHLIKCDPFAFVAPNIIEDHFTYIPFPEKDKDIYFHMTATRGSRTGKDWQACLTGLYTKTGIQPYTGTIQDLRTVRCRTDTQPILHFLPKGTVLTNGEALMLLELTSGNIYLYEY